MSDRLPRPLGRPDPASGTYQVVVVSKSFHMPNATGKVGMARAENLCLLIHSAAGHLEDASPVAAESDGSVGVDRQPPAQLDRQLQEISCQ